VVRFALGTTKDAGMPFRSVKNTSIDPQTVEIMSQAYEAAAQTPKAADLAATSPSHAEWVKETLALRIIESATRGETDVIRLCEEAIDHLAKAKPFQPNRETNPFD
jgi:hypothetical protein